MKRRKIFAAVLTCLILCMSAVLAAFAAEGDTPGYLIEGSASGSTYTLEIQVENVFAYTGRIGLAYDTSKLTLQNGDSLRAFKMASGITSTSEGLETSEIVSASEGYVGTAWYCNSGLDALDAPAPLATLTFTMKNGVTAEDIDATTFRLRVVESGSLDPWTASAKIQGKGDRRPIPYEYLTDLNPLSVDFAYDGSDTVPADGKTISFRCTNVLNEAIPAEMTLGGKVYTTNENGIIELVLGEGEYQYRAVADGYGDVNGVLAVSEDEEVVVTFINDEDLVAQAKSELEIGYQSGDYADFVTDDLTFLQMTDTGVSISWSSDNTSVITNEGFVFLPSRYGADVTIVATLTRGSFAETKTFTVYVCSKAELRPVEETKPSTKPEEEEDEKPIEDDEVKPIPVTFEDIAAYDWAKDAIERMAAVGIIKGTSDTTFAPSANIKRGDFVLLLMRMFDVDVSPAEAFADVPADSYYYEALAKARALGIAQGTGANLFNPEASITRQDMITFVMRALDKTGYLTISDARDDLSSFTDKDLLAGYAFDSMSAAVAEGLIVGSGGILNPTGNTTRAEAAVFIARIYDAHNARGEV